MPGKLAEHHTLADWDFQYGSTNRSLSAETFVSSPTSLRFMKYGAGAWNAAVLCRIPATLLLPQGEVRTWVYGYDALKVVALFRNQAALGSANYTNTYGLAVSNTTSTLIRYIGGAYSVRDSSTFTGFINQWFHTRVFFYNGKTPGDAPALCVDVYREITGQWVKQGDTLYDTANSWKDSGINRAGFRGYSLYNHKQYWDDTEIWGPV